MIRRDASGRKLKFRRRDLGDVAAASISYRLPMVLKCRFDNLFLSRLDFFASRGSKVSY
jgi:hypothetical protein